MAGCTTSGPLAWFSDSGFGFGPTSGIQSQMTHMYFARQLNNSATRIYTWTEGSGTITWADIGHASYLSPLSYCVSQDGTNMCQNDNDWIRGGWVENGRIGFMWDAKDGSSSFGNMQYPWVMAIEVDQSTMNLIYQPIIACGGNSWAWPAVAVNNNGALGFSAAWTNGSSYPSTNELDRDAVSAQSCGATCYNVQVGSQGTNGPQNDQWGDFLTVRVASGSSNTFVGTAFAIQCPNSDCSQVAQPIQPMFLWFGRLSDQTPTP